MNKVVAFSISTLSHVAQAACFFESLDTAPSKEDLPTERILFLVGASGTQPRLVNSPAVRCIHVETVVAQQIIDDLARRYTPAEVCWALKPILLAWLAKSFEVCLYFDSDIFFLGQLSDILKEMGDSSILLTPHYLSGFSHTNFGTNSLTLLRSGVFNAGFIGVRADSQTFAFLEWWAEQVARFGRNDPDNGMCGDQRWLDLVPVLFRGCKIARHRGMNVGYWNVHERRVDRCDGKFLADRQPLVFFHFSGFSTSVPLALSSHLRNFEATGALADIVRSYAQRLKESVALYAHLPNDYSYRRWWHGAHKRYRFVLDRFRNPRAC